MLYIRAYFSFETSMSFIINFLFIKFFCSMKKSYKFLFRFPRIFAIAFILFISMFALDIFWQWYTFWETVLGLFIHLIPSLFLTIVLILSRKKYPLVGAIGFGVSGIFYTFMCIINFIRSLGFEAKSWHLLIWPLQIALPALIIGRMFFRYWKLKKKGKISI